jgi:hypothetical protein
LPYKHWTASVATGQTGAVNQHQVLVAGPG